MKLESCELRGEGNAVFICTQKRSKVVGARCGSTELAEVRAPVPSSESKAIKPRIKF